MAFDDTCHLPTARIRSILYSIFKMPNMKSFESEAGLLKALTHPARLAIIAVLREDEACVCHLEAVLGFRQAFISQHLMTLREAGLVADRRVGNNVYYHVADRRVFKVLDALRDPGEPRATFARPHLHCPCPKCTAARTRTSKPGVLAVTR